MRHWRWHSKELFALLAACVVLASTCGAVEQEEAQPPAVQPSAAAPSPESTPQQITRVAAHPALYPSERQLDSWVRAGCSAFNTGEAHDDVFSIWGVERWFWVPPDITSVDADVALLAVSCETPQLLATHAAWRGTRSALPDTRIIQTVYSQLAEQAGYCRFLVVGLTKSPAESLGLEYVLNVHGVRCGEPSVSSFYGGAYTVPSESADGRDYTYVSVEFAERLDVEYAVEVEGTTYDRASIRRSVGYERRTSVSVVHRPTPAPYRYLVSEIVDFPLLRDDGLPLIPADAHTIALEMLAPAASYEVSVSIEKDDSYLRDEPPMVDFMRAVTMIGISGPRRGVAFPPKSTLRQALEDIAKRPEYADWILKIYQVEPKVPTITISVQPGRSPYETKKALKALVLEGQKACEDGNLVVILDVRGRRLFEARYHPASKSVEVKPVS